MIWVIVSVDSLRAGISISARQPAGVEPLPRVCAETQRSARLGGRGPRDGLQRRMETACGRWPRSPVSRRFRRFRCDRRSGGVGRPKRLGLAWQGNWRPRMNARGREWRGVSDGKNGDASWPGR